MAVHPTLPRRKPWDSLTPQVRDRPISEVPKLEVGRDGEQTIFLLPTQNGAGYVDTEEKIKAICEGIKKHLKIKSPKSSVVTKKLLLKKEQQGHASQKPEVKLEAKPEAKLEAKPEAKTAAKVEAKPEVEAELTGEPLTGSPASPEMEKKAEVLLLTETTNDLETPVPR